MIHVLVVDDDPGITRFFQRFFAQRGVATSSAHTVEEFNLQLEKEFHLALVDIRFGPVDGVQLINQITRKHPHCAVIAITGYASVKTAVQAMKAGARDFIEKPFTDIDQLQRQLGVYLKQPDPNRDEDDPWPDLCPILRKIGMICSANSPLLPILRIAMRIADSDIPILILGETGVGKEQVARFVHEASSRQNNPFLAINCAAISDTLLESELFGHEKGSFTGATETRQGLLELANKGTLLLDEVADMPVRLQTVLLRVLEQKEFLRVGGRSPIRSDARILSATNRPVDQLAAEGTFREDLLYRLDGIRLEIPPLRYRKDDILLMMRDFLKRQDFPEDHVSPDVERYLTAYAWPGNVRELNQALRHAMALAGKGPITPEHLPARIRHAVEGCRQDPDGFSWDQDLDQLTKRILQDWLQKKDCTLEELEQTLKQLNREVLFRVVEHLWFKYQKDKSKVCKVLGINERKFRYILYELRPDRGDSL
ncbi:sigma-54-dependent Fis family transcriptional regulator [Kyrpidia spormannii]|uniref:Sigma-54-dependent Fis family transcriptional regulator n=1 Tax=Kyrpidia spormannii TaxID=2055160 RepID=A0A2K8N819_9BACL|nr:sigma-54 dependent transcriptional regulator [Kyrpidia spormannii]ATY84572.1 sigma-54-dependent Fis family transcriptional regulator [Kyrpidia spormannii]